MLRRAVLPLLVLGGTLTACEAPRDPDAPRTFRVSPDEVASFGEEIRDGYATPDDHAAVGIVSVDGNYIGICSGSLIAPNLVLTARHCVSDTLGDNNGVHCSSTSSSAPFSASTFYVTTQLSMPQNPSGYRGVVEVVTLPVADSLLCGQDMAMLILDENVPPEEATPYVPRVDTPLVAGEQYYAIGYGSTDDAGNGSGMRRRRDNLFVECFAEGCGERWDLKTTEWEGDTGICGGDSGGPALDMQNRVIGVTSRGSYGCDDPIYGSTYGWAQWIKDTAARAATMGGYPPAPWVSGWPTDPQYSYPVGDACADSAACTSNLCWDGTCTRLCNEAAPCPEGFACEAPPEMGGASICVVPAPPEEEPEEDEDEDDDGGASSSGDAADGSQSGGGCAVSGGQKDPVNPVPWIVGLALGALRLSRRRR